MSVFGPAFKDLKAQISQQTLTPFGNVALFFRQKKINQPTTNFQTTLTNKELEEDFISSGGVETLAGFVITGDELQYEAAMFIVNYLILHFPRVCESIGTNRDVIQSMVKQLGPNSKRKLRFSDFHTVATLTMMNLRYISALEATRGVLIASGVLEAAKMIIEKKEEGEISAILLLANLIGPSEAKADRNLAASEGILEKLINGFKTENYEGKPVPISTQFPSFRRLSINDQNKREMVKRGIVPIWISKLGAIKEDGNILSEMLELMLNLSLLDENHPSLTEAGIPETLKKLSTENVVTSTHKKIIEQILWKMGAFQPQTNPSNTPPQSCEGPIIMISYNWENQPVVKDIAAQLKAQGYHVWLDLEEMVGSSVGTMAHAVEISQVVLICLSLKYKESPNCRLEGEYAFKRRKVIIPLLMQPQYDADGWLGAIVGTKIYYKFTKPDQFEAGIQGVLKELRKLGFQSTTVEQPPPHTTTKQMPSTPKADPTSWNTTQVGEWLESIGFGNLRKTFEEQKVNGKALACLTGAIQKGSPMWTIVQPGGGLGFGTIGEGLCFLFELHNLFS